jgi:hypothetical protein
MEHLLSVAFDFGATGDAIPDGFSRARLPDVVAVAVFRPYIIIPTLTKATVWYLGSIYSEDNMATVSLRGTTFQAGKTMMSILIHGSDLLRLHYCYCRFY